MSVMFDLYVTELLCSRLCHDLVSPVGAINNGVELLEESGPGTIAEALALISQSGQRAASRLRCFRLAYGAAGGQATVSLGEVRDVALSYLDGGKVTLEWPNGEPALTEEMPRGTAKLVLNLVMFAEEVLGVGGVVSVSLSAPSRPDSVTITATGRAAKLSEEAAAALDGRTEPGELTARTVHAFVTGQFARHYGLPMHAAKIDDRVVLTIDLKP